MQATLNLNLWTIREAREEDKDFISKTWLPGLYYGNDWYNKIDKEVYFSTYPKVVKHFLDISKIRVACLPEDFDVILGYCVYQDNKLHYLYVKNAWRKLGVAKSLIPQGINTCTHLTKIGANLLPKGWKFNPFS